jgi:hypothetical protein
METNKDLNNILDQIIEELTNRANALSEMSSVTKTESLLFESIGIDKAINVIKTYKYAE